MLTNYATNIALIDRETSLVTNIIWGMVYQENEFNTETRLAVVINDLGVVVGDTYDGESFYHNEKKVLSLSEQLAAALAENEDMKTALNTMGVTVDG